MLARKYVYRILVPLIHGQARGDEWRATRTSPPNGSREPRPLRRQAGAITRRVTDRKALGGPGLEADIVGWLAALALGCPEARAEITRLAPPGLLDGVDWTDQVAVCERLMPSAVEAGP
jgi:hypothetical protein